MYHLDEAFQQFDNFDIYDPKLEILNFDKNRNIFMENNLIYQLSDLNNTLLKMNFCNLSIRS